MGDFNSHSPVRPVSRSVHLSSLLPRFDISRLSFSLHLIPTHFGTPSGDHKFSSVPDNTAYRPCAQLGPTYQQPRSLELEGIIFS